MKKVIVSAFAVMASVVGFASTVESSNTFGVLKVTLSKSKAPGVQEQYFIGVPWVAVGTGNSVDPTSLVMTTGLETNAAPAMLYAYGQGQGESASGKFGAWYVDNNGVWKPYIITSTDSEQYVSGLETGASVAQGSGVVVKTSAETLYLSGQYKAISETNTNSVHIANSSDGAVWTLISAKTADNYDLNQMTVGEDENINEGDFIVVDGSTIFARRNVSGTWKWVNLYNTSSDAILGVGRGAWYCRTKNAGDLTLTFGTPVATTPAE